MDVAALNKQFGKAPNVEVNTGDGGLVKVHLKHSNGSHADIYLNGGHVSNWTNAKGDSVIFMSSKAIFKDGKAIRGGKKQ